MKYLQQIYFEMRHQKMMTWVSIAGTALAIFLVMVFYLVDRLNTVEVAPESNRDRILIGQNMHVGQGKYDASSALNHHRAQQLYHGLEGVERESYTTCFIEDKNIFVPQSESFSVPVRDVDDEFWRIYDFTFIDGKPFDKEDVSSGVNKVIISQSLARRLFNDEKAVGREVMLDMKPHIVSGVVKDANPILPITSAALFGIYAPESPNKNMGGYEEWLGHTQVVLLLKPGADRQHIKEQVKERYKRLQAEAKTKELEVFYHEQPYDTETIAKHNYGGNTSPKNDNTMKWVIYSILILLPAINLSSMTRSRLRYRISEIGVRRAFGATRSSILWQILVENLIITLAGGVIGLLLSALFMVSFSDLFFAFGYETSDYVRPSIEMVFTWSAFLTALLFCFILNLLSGFVPSWKASRITPSEAIGKVK